MKVFVSSVIRGFEPFREAAVEALRVLGHEPVRAEDFGASPDSPQQACLAGVRASDAVVLLLGARYGARQASGRSATHEEYLEARERCPVLVFVQEGMEWEPEQDAFVNEVQDWAAGHLTMRFASLEELRDAVIRALRDLELSRAVGPVDEEELLVRARTVMPAAHGLGTARLVVVVTGGPYQQVIRPAELEDPGLEDELLQEAMFGPTRLLDRRAGTASRIEGHALLLEQGVAGILLDEVGTVRMVHPALRDQGRGLSLPVLIEEETLDLIERSLRFAGWIMDRVDSLHRLSDVAPLVGLVGAGYVGWRTRAEHERSPHSVELGMARSDPLVVALSPARRHRSTLKLAASRLAEDFTALLRREMRRGLT